MLFVFVLAFSMYDPATVLVALHNRAPSKCVRAAAFVKKAWRKLSEQSLGRISYFNGHLFTLSLCHLFHPLITNAGRIQFTVVSIKANIRDLNAGLYHCICSVILNPGEAKGQETFLSLLERTSIDK